MAFQEEWPLVTGRNQYMFRFTLSSGLSRGVGLSKGVPLYITCSLRYI